MMLPGRDYVTRAMSSFKNRRRGERERADLQKHQEERKTQQQPDDVLEDQNGRA